METAELRAKMEQLAAQAMARRRSIPDPAPPIAETHVPPPKTAAPFPIKKRASLPRFDRITIDEARILSATEPPQRPNQLSLPLDDPEIIDSCPSWLLHMYHRANTIQRHRGPMPLSFSILMGALVTTAVRDRTGHEIITAHPLDDVISWIYPHRWHTRARDWHKLDRAFEELPTYRVLVDKYRVWLVVGEGLPETYEPNATVILRKRIPASSAYGIRIDWPTFVSYRSSALMTRAYLSVHALMDRSAYKGNPITRYIREPLLTHDGSPKRSASGHILRSRNIVPNPLANRVAYLPDQDVARFLGMANRKQYRHYARQALARLHNEGIVEVVKDQRGYRFYGPPENPDPSSRRPVVIDAEAIQHPSPPL